MLLSALRHAAPTSRGAALPARPDAVRAVPTPACVPRRLLNIHEFQSQHLMAHHGINVPRGAAADTPKKAYEAAKGLHTDHVVIKAQVLAGGRGKGHFTNGFQGGVHLCSSADQVKDIASKMLGQVLVTKQTGEQGKPCNTVFVTEQLKIKEHGEKYFAILLDRKIAGPMIIASHRGGMNIEDVAAESPDDIVKIPLKLGTPLSDADAARLADALRFSPALRPQAAEQMKKMYALFSETDCTLLEVNPFVETADGRVMCLDAKINFDDNAEHRQSELFQLRDHSQEDPREVAAAKWDLNFIGLEGNIGCLVNGAGLAMATMDMIKLKGGAPANFLDVGGGATERQVTEAFRILQSDPRVRAILVNIFGGIMRCDIIALGIIHAAKEVGLKVPVVCRLAGTNVEQAKMMMEQSGMKIIPAEDLDNGAEKAVNIARIVDMARLVDLDVHFEIPL